MNLKFKNSFRCFRQVQKFLFGKSFSSRININLDNIQTNIRKTNLSTNIGIGTIVLDPFSYPK